MRGEGREEKGGEGREEERGGEGGEGRRGFSGNVAEEAYCIKSASASGLASCAPQCHLVQAGDAPAVRSVLLVCSLLLLTMVI